MSDGGKLKTEKVVSQVLSDNMELLQDFIESEGKMLKHHNC